MAYKNATQGIVWSFPAGEDLSAAQYHFVKLMDDGTVDLVDGATDNPIGVLQDIHDGTVGSMVSVMLQGVSKVRAGAAVPLLDGGTPIKSAADGEGVAMVIGTDTTHYTVGQALSAASADQSIFTAFIDCMKGVRAA